jgi:hypothetical protein
MDAISDQLLSERGNLVRRIEDTKLSAFEAKRDLNDTERETISRHFKRVGELDEQLKITTRDLGLDAATAAAVARYSPSSVPATGVQWRTAGECLFDYLNMHTDQAAADRVKAFKLSNRAAEHMGTTAAVTVPTAGGFGGLIVSPATGPVIDLSPRGMPVISAFGSTDVGGGTFMRPRIVDPDLFTAAGPQAGGKEKAELPSKKFDVLSDPVTLVTIGNYLNLSLQAEAWVPGSLDIVVRQLNRRTELGADKQALAKLATTTATVPLAVDADAAEVLAAIYDAAAIVYRNTGALPTTLLAGPAGWANLGGLADLAGRPLFPSLGAVNAPGTSTATSFAGTVAGLSVVITPGITDESMYVANSVGLEVYLHRWPMLQVVEPSILGRQIGSAVALGFYQPVTTEAVTGGSPAPAKYEAVVKIVVS